MDKIPAPIKEEVIEIDDSNSDNSKKNYRLRVPGGAWKSKRAASIQADVKIRGILAKEAINSMKTLDPSINGSGIRREMGVRGNTMDAGVMQNGEGSGSNKRCRCDKLPKKEFESDMVIDGEWRDKSNGDNGVNGKQSVPLAGMSTFMDAIFMLRREIRQKGLFNSYHFAKIRKRQHFLIRRQSQMIGVLNELAIAQGIDVPRNLAPDAYETSDDDLPDLDLDTEDEAIVCGDQEISPPSSEEEDEE